MRDHDLAEVTARMGEASEWLVRLQEDNVTEADVAAWLKWCAADISSLEAFERVQGLYDHLQALPPAEKKAFLKLRHLGSTRAVAPDVFWRAIEWCKERTRPLVASAMAASAAVVMLIAARHYHSPSIEALDYQSPRGVQEALLLSDRSRVTLASASELLSHFTPTARYVDLREGEAYFEVEHDKRRPFVVKAGAMTVTAVGTKFNVRTTGTRTVVAVTEGAVDVTTDEAAQQLPPNARSRTDVTAVNTSPVRLRAGQQAVRDTAQPGLLIVDVSAAAAVGWRQGRLQYVMEPLSSVVDDVNRYASRRVVLKDPSLGELVFTGTIFIDRVDEWAMTLPAAFPVSAAVAADGTLTLEPRTDGKRSISDNGP